MKSDIENHFASLRQQATGENTNVQAALNSPLNFVVPVEAVELPSRGVFYPEGHPLRNKETIEIKQMTAREEDILTNKSFIKKGIVIDKLIEALLVDKSIPVSSLLIGDKNAIMVAARCAGYGPTYDVMVTCLECGSKNQIVVNLEEIVTRDLSKIEEMVSSNNLLRHERQPNGNITIKLPKCGWEVSCKLLSGEDEKKIMSFAEAKKKLNLSDSEISLSEQLMFIVDSVSGVDDKSILKNVIGLMPAYDAKFLRNTYAKLVPNVAIEKHFTCVACSSEQDLEVPFTQEFFWPK
jgi:hypothetical protein